MQSGCTEQREIHVLGGTEQDSMRFHYIIQNGLQFKTYELFNSVIFHVIFLDCSWPQVTKMAEWETTGEGDHLNDYSTTCKQDHTQARKNSLHAPRFKP